MKIEGYNDYCTVGDLKKFLEKHNLPDNAKILLQRVEDKYFEAGNVHPQSSAWETIKKEGLFYHQAIERNEKIVNGEYNDKEQYPLLDEESIKAMYISEEELETLKEQFVVAWCPVKYENDDNLYFHAHY